ncbi:Interferon gamma receptor 1, partial [Apaloderma vittatum]
VPSPTQVVITSENFKTVLHWQYPSMSETPLFTVRFISYKSGSCELVSTCVNISANFCDISREIHDPDTSHWFQVQAVVGSQRSKYSEAEEFILRRHGEF